MTPATGHPAVPRRYTDASGTERKVPDETLRWLAERLGPDEPEAAPVPLVVRPGRAPLAGLAEGQLHLEDGTVIDVGAGAAEVPLGYHEHVDREGVRCALIVAPPACHLPEERSWGWAVQLYAARSEASWGIGDLGDLARLARWSARSGAGFLLANPLGANAPSGPQQPSPYFPGTRRFRSPLYLDVGAVPQRGTAADLVDQVGAVGRALSGRRTIDRDEVWALKRRALEAIWASEDPDARFERWLAVQGPSLHRFAAWCAVADRHGPDWRRWSDDASRQVDQAGPPERTVSDAQRFHAWLQWLLEGQLAEAGRHLTLVQDLPIGVDPGGFDAWEWQDLLALDVSVGAPPDELNRAGQDWGLPPFLPGRLREAGYQPFAESIRSAMLPGGGLRIDHVMGLFRLWWIPPGRGPEAGAYVHYPFDDLLAVVALESHRAGAVVVGEDLGTVEEEVRRALIDQAVLSYRLLWFEDDEPERWPVRSMAAVTTHDLPTVAGLWSGSDLAEQRALGLHPNEESTSAMRADLADAGDLTAGSSTVEAVRAAHGLLARAPSLLVAATLDDALAVAERPNVPGADGDRPNWSLALPAML
ncbi:MAG: 4-alpha-glucanotransferase, partial [Actinobacteria bacterium]|nr:4-alpha-glucanotransferase [Actinomycetota bacterium]